LRPNGSWVDVTWQVLPDGRRLVTHRDVTERKRREQELQQANAALERERVLMQAILDNMTDGIALCEENGDIALWNDAVYAVNGFPRGGFRNIEDALRWQNENGQFPESLAAIEDRVSRMLHV